MTRLFRCAAAVLALMTLSAPALPARKAKSSDTADGKVVLPSGRKPQRPAADPREGKYVPPEKRNLKLQQAWPCEKGCIRLVYWNIQNGMWSGQPEDYRTFIRWVKLQKPDICVWVEAQPHVESNKVRGLRDVRGTFRRDDYLLAHWKPIARAYGHKYLYLSAHPDNHPQLITSKYPIENVERLTGEQPDSVLWHGAGWAKMTLKGKTLNLVTTHTWPFWYGKGVNRKDKAAVQASGKDFGGERYRKREMEWLVRHTILTHPDAAQEYWMMLGDFNARSFVDHRKYKKEADDPLFMTHRVIADLTPYRDVLAEKHPGKFISTEGKGWYRIDFIYATPALLRGVSRCEVVSDFYTTPLRDPEQLSNFWHPSDHRPLIMDFKLD